MDNSSTTCPFDTQGYSSTFKRKRTVEDFNKFCTFVLAYAGYIPYPQECCQCCRVKRPCISSRSLYDLTHPTSRGSYPWQWCSTGNGGGSYVTAAERHLPPKKPQPSLPG
ncbi:PHD finger protein 23A-like isoform X1 [Pseudorasbora parva]|uniref:PHD finger protein 23A-like isoform X1 n=1 Tax=Pseudorasbora parva TaxID=51549 RepID=UPI00351DD669